MNLKSDDQPASDAAVQFTDMASRYATSVPHSTGDSLQILGRFAEGRRYRAGLDVATGPGFTAFKVAPLCESVIASDPAPGMLEQVESLAGQRGIENVSTRLAYAEDLPFEDGAFDLVTCRTAPHHFKDLARSLSEMHRVLEPGGALLLVDTVTPEDPALAAWQNEIEARRDGTHVRDRSPSEWRRLITDAGLQIDEEAMTTVDMDVDSWLDRSGTPEDEAALLREEWRSAPDDVKRAFLIEPGEGADNDNHTFSWPVYVCRAHRPTE